jgi:putative membrane protein
MTLLVRWIVLALSVIATSWITASLGLGFRAEVKGAGDFFLLMIGVAVFALLNATLGTILKLLTIPLNCMTLGLFSFVINAFILYLAAEMNLGFSLTDKEGGGKFLSALVASVLISAINGLLGSVLIRDKGDDD